MSASQGHHSKMGPTRWNAEEMPDLRGKLAVVTGANSGIGLACALELARHGASTVMACRDLRRAESAMARVKEEARTTAGNLELRRLDLADLSSVRAFASEMRTAHPQIDILIDNAGLMAVPFLRTSDGFEMQFGINHLGHFALTGLVLPCLLSAKAARVVVVTSILHSMGRIDFSDLMGERRYGSWRAYAQSKLANVLFAFELARRAAHGKNTLVSVAAHPGFAVSNLPLATPQMRGRALLKRMSTRVTALAAQPSEAGALPILFAATSGEVKSGDFYGPAGYRGARGLPVRTRASSRAYDLLTARRLWDRSVELTGVDYVELDHPARE